MPVFGEASGTILWTSDLLAALGDDAVRSDGADIEASLQAAFGAWEAVTSSDGEEAHPQEGADLPGAAVGNADIEHEVGGTMQEITSASIVSDSPTDLAPADNGTSAREGVEPGNEMDEDGFLEAVFGWILEIFESIFGGEVDLDESAVDVVDTGPEIETEIEPTPSLANDIVLIEYIPALMVDEESDTEDQEPEDNEPGGFAFLM